MIPSLSPLSASKTASTTIPGRPDFRPVVGIPRHVNIGLSGAALPGLTAAQQNGLRYEAKVQYFLEEVLNDYFPTPVFYFEDDTGKRKCVPDGMLLPLSSERPAFIFEIKSQHMPEAWHQLRQLYQPVVRRYLENTGRFVGVIEVCKSYDPAMPFPEKVELISDLQGWIRESRESFGVLVWKP